MTQNIATITVSGNLVANPKVQGQEGNVVTMRLASERYYRKPDNSWEATDHLFIDVVAFGKLGDHCARSLRKGMPVVVSGRLLTNEYTRTDEDTGEEQRRRTLRIRAEHVGPDLARVIIKEAVIPLNEGSRTFQLGTIDAADQLDPVDSGNAIAASNAASSDSRVSSVSLARKSGTNAADESRALGTQAHTQSGFDSDESPHSIGWTNAASEDRKQPA